MRLYQALLGIKQVEGQQSIELWYFFLVWGKGKPCETALLWIATVETVDFLDYGLPGVLKHYLVGYRWLTLHLQITIDTWSKYSHVKWCESERYCTWFLQCSLSGLSTWDSGEGAIMTYHNIELLDFPLDLRDRNLWFWHCPLTIWLAKREQIGTNTGPTCLIGTSCSTSVTIRSTLNLFLHIRNYIDI